MDPELLTYVRLSSALDTESTPVVVLAHDPTTQRSLIIDVISEADKDSVEERLQGIQWSQMVLQYVPMHTWVSLDQPPRTFLERVQACQQATISHDHILRSVVEELQRGTEDDPTWPTDVRDYVHQLRASFCSPVESTDSEESRVLSPVPNDTPHIPATDATTATDEAAPAPQETPAPPATEELDEGVPEAVPQSTEAPAEETESAFVKKNKGKGKSKKHY